MTNAELAILGLIVEQSRHGYEIEAVIEERGMRDWTELSFSSIYFILKKLAQNGWVEGRLERASGRRPVRKVYAITPAGREAWRQATLEALSEPVPCFQPIQIGLTSLPGIAPDEALAALRQFRERLAERREYVASRRAHSGGQLPVHVAAIFDLSLTMIEAEAQWASQFIRLLEQQNSANH